MAQVTISGSTSREAVLEAAHRLIIHHGYAGLSMRELARSSGLAKGTIYHHFQDKRDIYLSVLERDILTVRNRIAHAAKKESSCTEQLEAVIRTYLDLQRERRFVILLALRESAGMEKQLCELAKTYRDELIKPVAAIIEQGIAQGALRPVNVEMTVISLFGMLHSFVTHRLILDDAEIGDDVVAHTIDILLHGIRTDSVTESAVGLRPTESSVIQACP
jgi:AcrR family transcriptional regulator